MYLFWHMCLFSKGNETPSSERKAHLNKYTSSSQNQSEQERGFKATTWSQISQNMFSSPVIADSVLQWT